MAKSTVRNTAETKRRPMSTLLPPPPHPHGLRDGTHKVRIKILRITIPFNRDEVIRALDYADMAESAMAKRGLDL